MRFLILYLLNLLAGLTDCDTLGSPFEEHL